MEHYRSLKGIQIEGVWLTIGSFDGVHRGHQEIVDRLVKGAAKVGAPTAVMTFDPHPSVVLGKRARPFYLTSLEERARLLGDMGIDIVVTLPFNLEVAQMTAMQFMVHLKEHLGIRYLFVGYDFALGRGREGNVPRLEQLGKELDYRVETIKPIEVDGEIVSSSRIREYLSAGDVERASHLLGRPYRIYGSVIPGDGRGKSIGIPTANLSVWEERALPKAGVYVCQVNVNDRWWGAVTNIGYRPTFETQVNSPRVESHILNFGNDIYGQEVKLDFLAHLRDEIRFSSIADLVDQIREDISEARNILS